MTHDELIPKLQAMFKSLGADLTFRTDETEEGVVTDSDVAIEAAEGDTGWSLPLTDKSQIRWFIERTRRHLISHLLLDKAMKFQAKSFSLQQQWEHLWEMIKKMDENWVEFRANEDMTGLEEADRFGQTIGTGLIYDDFGNESLGEVSLWPSE